ncbi:MAG: hypothetical protein C4308_01485 [Chitinophagaceae bacterium]
MFQGYSGFGDLIKLSPLFFCAWLLLNASVSSVNYRQVFLSSLFENFLVKTLQGKKLHIIFAPAK